MVKVYLWRQKAQRQEVKMNFVSKEYGLEFEISGRTAMFARPDTGICQVSYPAPTFGSLKGTAENVLFLKHAEVIPVKVEICSPLKFAPYKFNYTGPMRKSSNIKSGDTEQFRWIVLLDVCYRVYARTCSIGPWNGVNSGHAYQAMFNRRLKSQSYWQQPFLGVKDFTVDYIGPFREKTKVCKDINLSIDGMLLTCFPDGRNTPVRPVFFDAAIKEGVLQYPSHVNAHLFDVAENANA